MTYNTLIILVILEKFGFKCKNMMTKFYIKCHILRRKCLFFLSGIAKIKAAPVSLKIIDSEQIWRLIFSDSPCDTIHANYLSSEEQLKYLFYRE